MKKAEKTFLVDNLTETIKAAKSITVVDYQGLNTRDVETLRQSVQSAGGSLSVVKNTLLKRAIESVHGRVDETAERGLDGPTAVIIAKDDEVAPLQKVGKMISEKEKPKLKFGIFANEILDSAKLLTLSRLPSKNVLLGQTLGAITGPLSGLTGTLNSNLQSLVYILSAKASENSDS